MREQDVDLSDALRGPLKRLWAYRRGIAFYAVLLAVGWAIGDFVQSETIADDGSHTSALMGGMILGALSLYVIAAAIPFVPAAEIGFALLFVFGGAAVPLVYLGMVGALILSYAVARLVPTPAISGWLAWLGFPRQAALIRRIHETPREERISLLLDRVPPGLARTICANRYVALGLLINLPGNMLLGGGGGLAFAAGASGVYAAPAFVLTVMIAVSPVPAIFWLVG